MRRSLSIGLAFVLLVTSIAAARTPTGAEQDLFRRANAAYEASDWNGAITAYDQLLKEGLQSPALYLNHGNASLKAGHLGAAILSYRRALRLAPGDEDVRTNLDYARRRTQDARPQELADPFPWLTRLRPGPDRAAGLFVLFLNVAALAFAAMKVLRIRSPFLAPVLGAGAGLALLFGLVFFWEYRVEAARREGVVMVEAADVRSGPGDSYTVAFQVHEGTELSLGRGSSGWLEVSVTPELKGWVPAGVVEPIP